MNNLTLDHIWGNEQAKRAVEIAQKGNHSIKFIGNGEADMLKEYCKNQKLKAYAFKPCKCGYFGDNAVTCSCTPEQIKKMQKIIKQCRTDLTITTRRVSTQALTQRVELPYKLEKDIMQLLLVAVEKMHLDQQAILSLLATASTIATLVQCQEIKPQHLAEALQYRDREEI